MNIKVFIHLGPPKTATSAIQNWMQQNRDSLMQQGIYYPEHHLDKNGVSSGNVLNIFDRTNDKALLISKTKVEKVLAQCKQNNCKVLLLSSEFFFFQVENLLTVFPEAKLISYVRFPLEVIESSYNQAVKRHNQTQPLGLPAQPNAYHLVLLEKMLQKFAHSHFIIRFYSPEFFIGGNIVSDLLSLIGAKEVKIDLPRVNASYTFEALEFKRWANGFLTPQYQHRLDEALQSYRAGNDSYSLIKPAEYQRYVDWFSTKLDTFFNAFPVDDHQRFIESIKHKQQKHYIKQEMSVDEFHKVADYLNATDVGLVHNLSRAAAKSEFAIEKRPDFLIALQSAVPTTHKVKTHISDFSSTLLRKIKNIVFFYRYNHTPRLHVQVADLLKVRASLNIDAKISDGEVFRELALYFEQCGDLEIAYLLMQRADELRPNGPVITAKIAEYQDRLKITS